jgi:hypothetical protein
LDNPLPRDQRNLSIAIPGKSPIRFVAPLGWHIIQQPEREQNFTYVLSRKWGSFEQPTLVVWCEKAPVSTNFEQGELQWENLRRSRGHGECGSAEEAGFTQDSWPHTADGRDAWVYHYVGSNKQELRAIIPENGFTTTMALWAQTPEDIVANRRAFLALVRSYHAADHSLHERGD